MMKVRFPFLKHILGWMGWCHHKLEDPHVPTNVESTNRNKKNQPGKMKIMPNFPCILLQKTLWSGIRFSGSGTTSTLYVSRNIVKNQNTYFWTMLHFPSNGRQEWWLEVKEMTVQTMYKNPQYTQTIHYTILKSWVSKLILTPTFYFDLEFYPLYTVYIRPTTSFAPRIS